MMVFVGSAANRLGPKRSKLVRSESHPEGQSETYKKSHQARVKSLHFFLRRAQVHFVMVVVGFLTNGIGPNYPGWSGPNLIREVRLKLTKFVIKFALKVFTFSSGGHRSTL